MANTNYNKNLLDQYPKKAPSKLLFLTEGGRAAIGLGLYAASYNMLKKVPKGNGHPVLVIPGFMTSDRATTILRNYIKKLGYATKTWNLGINLGRPEYAFRLRDRIQEINAEHNCKVSLVGWSLGGVFAREVAREIPHLVNQVITLGSPFGGIFEPNNARWIYDFIHGPKGVDVHKELLENILEAPPVPTTAIYSKEDGIVNWQYCIERKESPITQNVQIIGSHFGLGHNPSALYCIAERLQQSTENWSWFAPEGKLKMLYPNLK